MAVLHTIAFSDDDGAGDGHDSDDGESDTCSFSGSAVCPLRLLTVFLVVERLRQFLGVLMFAVLQSLRTGLLVVVRKKARRWERDSDVIESDPVFSWSGVALTASSLLTPSTT